MKKIIPFSLLLFTASIANAQLFFLASAEGGYAGSTVKTDELPIFLNTYNTANASGLSKPFEMNSGMASGRYFHFMLGMGGAAKVTLGFGQYLVHTPHNEARFTAGDGRDVWVEIKDASTETGFRFDKGRFTCGFQFDILIRTVSIYSQYVFQDGSRSFAAEHQLNGVFSDNRLGVGTGANIGFRLFRYVYLVAKCDYVFHTDKSHPEYHDFMDLNYFKSTTPDYLPRDMTEYVNNPWNGSGNSISNDIHGLRFGFGIQVLFSTGEDE